MAARKRPLWATHFSGAADGFVQGSEDLEGLGDGIGIERRFGARIASGGRIFIGGGGLREIDRGAAEAARVTGGKVISLELAEAKVDYAKKRLRQADLASYVEFKVGDALASIEMLDEPIDFVLIDLWKDLYVPVFERLYPRLRSGAGRLDDA